MLKIVIFTVVAGAYFTPTEKPHDVGYEEEDYYYMDHYEEIRDKTALATTVKTTTPAKTDCFRACAKTCGVKPKKGKFFTLWRVLLWFGH